MPGWPPARTTGCPKPSTSSTHCSSADRRTDHPLRRIPSPAAERGIRGPRRRSCRRRIGSRDTFRAQRPPRCGIASPPVMPLRSRDLPRNGIRSTWNQRSGLPAGGRFFRQEFFRAILPHRKTNRSHPFTSKPLRRRRAHHPSSQDGVGPKRSTRKSISARTRVGSVRFGR